jgi:allophanate hydrolase subunit 1
MEHDMNNLDEKLSAFTAFFIDTTRGFEEISVVFERLVTNAESLVARYGDLEEEADADDDQNARLARFRMLYRDMTAFAGHCSVSIGALKVELDNNIEFAQTLLEDLE